MPPRELFHTFEAVRHLLAVKFDIVLEGEEFVGDGVGIERVDEESSLTGYLGHGRGVSCDERSAASHRLQLRDAEALAQRWIEKDRSAVVKSGEVGIGDISRSEDIRLDVGYPLVRHHAVDDVLFKVGNEKRLLDIRLLQIVRIGFQHAWGVLLRVRISEEEYISVGRDILMDSSKVGRQLSEMRAVAVVDGTELIVGQLQRLADTFLLEVGDGDDLGAVRQYARHHKAAVIPSHLLVERMAGRLPFLEEDDVVQRDDEWCGAMKRCCVAGAMEQVGMDALHLARQSILLPKRIGGAVELDDMEVARSFQAVVAVGVYDDKIIILVIYLLQLADCVESDKVHAVFVGPEDTLSFDSYFHDSSSVFGVNKLTACSAEVEQVDEHPPCDGRQEGKGFENTLRAVFFG
jgi:hypothetical protein